MVETYPVKSGLIGIVQLFHRNIQCCEDDKVFIPSSLISHYISCHIHNRKWNILRYGKGKLFIPKKEILPAIDFRGHNALGDLKIHELKVMAIDELTNQHIYDAGHRHPTYFRKDLENRHGKLNGNETISLYQVNCY